MLIPNELFGFLTSDDTYSIDTAVLQFGNEVERWCDLLVEKGFAFYTNDRSEVLNLKKLDLSFYEPRLVTNAIVDFDKSSNHNTSEIFKQLSELLCEALELRFFFDERIENIEDILSETNDSSFRSIELLLGLGDSLTEEKLMDLFERYPRVTKITVHSAGDSYFKEAVVGKRLLVYTETVIDSESHCGVVSPFLFASNLFLFAESQKNNSCLNRKVSIDRNGNIKNCPSMVKTFGTINTTKISDAVSLSEFQNVWTISKDQVDDCKVCEFRYMCQDCRAYTKDGQIKYSKPLKCEYDPYEAKWNA